jgi:hypothetical protein
MKAEIESALAVLVGKPLWSCGRAADMATFAFGERKNAKTRKGDFRHVGEYALHLQCAWRITQGDKVVVGSMDVYYPPDENE